MSDRAGSVGNAGSAADHGSRSAGGRRGILVRTLLFASVCVTALAALSATAFANSPNPTSIVLDGPPVVNGGNVTVTVSGTWTWDKSVPNGAQADCNDSRIGVGYAVGWGDNTA